MIESNWGEIYYVLKREVKIILLLLLLLHKVFKMQTIEMKI